MDKIIKTLILVAFLTIAAFPAFAQDGREPALPEPLANMRAEGAQMRYLGNANGLDGWIAIKNGQEQYFYVTEDGSAFLLGLLFDKTGKLQTVRQVKELQEKSGGALDMFTGDDISQLPQVAQGEQPGGLDQLVDRTQREFKTPAEQLYQDVEGSNWVAIGESSAPFIYSFIDPQCPHCHAFINDLRKDYIDGGKIQVRLIPVGFRDETRAQAAFLLAVPNPKTRWYSHLDGDAAALPVVPDINQQGVQRNLAVMQSWKVNVTPFTVYRARNGEVKIVQGRAQDIGKILTDLN